MPLFIGLRRDMQNNSHKYGINHEGYKGKSRDQKDYKGVKISILIVSLVRSSWGFISKVVV